MSYRRDLARYAQLVQNAWAELPGLVNVFVDKVSIHLDIPRAIVEDAVAELLKVQEYSDIDSVAQVLARTYILLAEEVTCKEPSTWGTVAAQERAGLANAAVHAFAEGGLAAVAVMDLRDIASCHVLDQHTAADGAVDPLQGLLEAAIEFRRAVLTGFVVCDSDALTGPAVDYALDLADIVARSINAEVPVLAEKILDARELGSLGAEELDSIWHEHPGFTLADWLGLEQNDDPKLDQRAEELQAIDGGFVPTWRLLGGCDGFAPQVLTLTQDNGPSLHGVLAHAPAEARFRVTTTLDSPDNYLVPLIDGLAFVKSFADIPALLRTSEYLPYSTDVVSREEALNLGCPELAGWYKLDWGTCF
jgi:hypothetical protein